MRRRDRLASEDLASYRAGNAAAAKRWRENNVERAKETKQRSINLFRAMVRAAKGKPCADCQVQYPYYVMQFDHLDANHKTFNVSSGVSSASRAKVEAEIAKCDVVCANCHAERTHQRSRR